MAARALCLAAVLLFASCLAAPARASASDEDDQGWLSDAAYDSAKRRLSQSLSGNFLGSTPSPSPELAPVGNTPTPGSYSPCTQSTNSDTTVCTSCSSPAGCNSCKPYRGVYPKTPWRLLSDDDGARDYNTCETCDTLLGCPTKEACYPNVGGCSYCLPGQYKNKVTVTNMGGSVTLSGCASCKADFGCDNCDAGGCLCSGKKFWWVPAGRTKKQGSCKECKDTSGPGCDVCYLTGECKTCKAPLLLDPLAKKCKTCKQVQPRCAQCNADATCKICEAGNFKSAGGICKDCAKMSPNCVKCLDGSVSSCSVCRSGYTLDASKKCVKKKTCQDVYGQNCSGCNSSLTKCLGCRFGSKWDSSSQTCVTCRNKWSCWWG